MKPEQIESLSRIAAAAVASEKATGMPAEVTCAQCALESGYLKVAPGNNCFGIKDTDRFPETQYVFTKEFRNGQWEKKQLAFEVYPTLAACFDDHARLIVTKPAYSKAWAQYQSDRDLESFVRGMAKKYATDPGYAAKLLTLMRSPNFVAALAKARESA